jgi:hypothetical protein
MPNFAHSVIYRIINKETGENLYIGSTTHYNQRIYEHKSNCNNPNRKHYNYPIYNHIRELGGWDFVKHIMIEEFSSCQNKLQLVKREQEHIDEVNSSQNAVRAFTSKEQRIEQQKQWVINNKEKHQEYQKQYRLKKKIELVQSL